MKFGIAFLVLIFSFCLNFSVGNPVIDNENVIQIVMDDPAAVENEVINDENIELYVFQNIPITILGTIEEKTGLNVLKHPYLVISILNIKYSGKGCFRPIYSDKNKFVYLC